MAVPTALLRWLGPAATVPPHWLADAATRNRSVAQVAGSREDAADRLANAPRPKCDRVELTDPLHGSREGPAQVVGPSRVPGIHAGGHVRDMESTFDAAVVAVEPGDGAQVVVEYLASRRALGIYNYKSCQVVRPRLMDLARFHGGRPLDRLTEPRIEKWLGTLVLMTPNSPVPYNRPKRHHDVSGGWDLPARNGKGPTGWNR